MRHIDWIALAIVAIAAFSGFRRGLVATALSLGGLALGAVVGSRLAPHFLHGGSSSPYTPMIGLGGALAGALLLQTVAGIAGSFARKSLWVVPPLRLLDSVGGLLAGAAFGAAVVWVAGVAALQLPREVPGLPRLRQDVQGSAILRRLDSIVPPRTILRAFARIDPFPAISGPTPPASPGDRRLLVASAVKLAKKSVVRIRATSCGLGVEGSGWVARPRLVVTAAHVVAGARGITANGHGATAVYIDRRDDIAILLVRSLHAAALPVVAPHSGDPVAILGYPEDGPFNAQPGRIGSTADVLVSGALREVTALSGLVRHGNSGGPAVNMLGQVEATIFAARIGSVAGYGIPEPAVLRALAHAKRPVSTGGC